MTTSKRKKMKSVLHNGALLATVSSILYPHVTGRVYANTESRGYKTDFSPKLFFYAITFEQGLPCNIRGLGAVHKRRAMREYWNAHPQELNYGIVNKELWTKMFS